MMNLTQANNDVMIAEAEVLDAIGLDTDVFHGVYFETHERDAKRMADLGKIKNVLDRRAAQAGVRPEIVRIEAELQKILPGTIVERGWAQYEADGFKASVSLSIEEQRSKSSGWRSVPTGKHKFVVGHYGERKTFPEKKDGSFSYDKIAQEIAERLRHDIKTMRMARETARATADARTLVGELKVRYNLGAYEGPFEAERTIGSRGNYQQIAPKPGMVFMKLGTTQVTPEQAVELYELLKRIHAENK